ncbi:hypothetical protein C2869_05240 [Saccharobesus litoralis]|uniref:Uncharacterized protein n=1 Tax=Saccharobesus litoralis TaxID=2172099 RepID=A0A2S0VNS4_9ALTE|nr:hypothetical protein C2869_05240 [Saccharobesus litoralis]
MSHMEIILGVIFVFFLFYIALLGRENKQLTKEQSEWEAIPTLEEYLRKYPSCKTNFGIRCNYCNSNRFRAWGRSSKHDPQRVMICFHCNNAAYKLES